MLLCAICERLPLLLEIYSPTDSTDTHRFYIFQYPCSSMLSVGDSFCCLRFILPQIPQISQILYIPVSVFICAICGKLLRPRYPCSSPISVGAILCILRLFSHRFHGFSQMHLEIVLPQIPQIFTDFIYPRIRVHLCYLWEILSHPISVLICDICGSHPLLLEIYSPTDSTDIHRFYIFQYPCSSVLSVGNTFAPNICVHLRYLWEPPSAA